MIFSDILHLTLANVKFVDIMNKDVICIIDAIRSQFIVFHLP